MVEYKSLAQQLYERYSEFSEGKSLVSGQHLPPWPTLPEKIAQAWREVAGHAIKVVIAKVNAIQKED